MSQISNRYTYTLNPDAFIGLCEISLPWWKWCLWIQEHSVHADWLTGFSFNNNLVGYFVIQPTGKLLTKNILIHNSKFVFNLKCYSPNSLIHKLNEWDQLLFLHTNDVMTVLFQPKRGYLQIVLCIFLSKMGNSNLTGLAYESQGTRARKSDVGCDKIREENLNKFWPQMVTGRAFEMHVNNQEDKRMYLSWLLLIRSLKMYLDTIRRKQSHYVFLYLWQWLTD